MNILVTGSTGFIGRHLVKKLALNKNNNIYCQVRDVNKAKRLENYKVNLIYSDITDYEELKSKIPQKLDIIFHTAARVSNLTNTKAKPEEKKLMFKVNVLGTENICKISKELNVNKLIYVSSVSVICGNKERPLRDDMTYSVTSLYGESKLDAERIVLDYREKGLNCVIIRPCMIYGKDEPHMLERLKFLVKRRFIPLLNGGKYKWQIVYIENVIDFMIYSMDNEKCLKGTFIVADDEALTQLEVIGIIRKSVSGPKPLVFNELCTNIFLKIPILKNLVEFFAHDRIFDISRIKEAGFYPKYLTKEYLAKSCE